MSRPLEKFTCPACNEKCIGRIEYNEFLGNTFYRYRACEKCRKRFVTAEKIIGLAKRHKNWSFDQDRETI